MASPEIVSLVSAASVSVIYAFINDIQLSRKASKLRKWLERERPELWSNLNVFARNWKGGQPGLKLLHRNNVIDLRHFDQQYEQLRVVERRVMWGVVLGSMCMGVAIMGSWLWGWQW